MKRTGFLYDQRYLMHDTGAYHPEQPDRLLAIFKGIQEAGLLEKLRVITAQPADMKWIETVHSRSYINRFEEVCLCGNSTFDCTDNQMCTQTFETAVLAVGGVLDMCRLVVSGELDNGFCAVRPPGHHAEAEEGMGFCYFNNIAIAARYLQLEHGIGKVFIFDFDVHHGNATQHTFEADPTVFYYSMHEHPSFAFPGTGREFEKGVGKGFGFTRNVPMLPGSGDKEYKEHIEHEFISAVETFGPEVILVSAGFDGHADDDMSDIRLSTEFYTWLMKIIVELAGKHCRGRLVSVLEGGYCIARLPELARNHVQVLLNSR
jgi:acetoin utilization deacetylase AcuC-like enzyme